MAKARKQAFKAAASGAAEATNTESVSVSAVPAQSVFASEAAREAWIKRECAFVYRFLGNEHEARRLAELHASSGNVAAYNALRGW